MGILKQRLAIRLAVDFCGLLVGTLVVVGAVVLWSSYRTLQQATFEKLKVAATLKEYELTQWVQQQQENLLWLAQTPEFSRRVMELQQAELNTPAHNEAQGAVLAYLQSAVTTRMDFEEAMVLTPSGIVLASSQRSREGTYQPLGNSTTYFDPRAPQAPQLTLYRALDTGAPRLTFAVPLGAVSETDAVLAVHLNLDSIDHIIRYQTGLGDASEAYLIGRDIDTTDGVFISSSDAPAMWENWPPSPPSASEQDPRSTPQERDQPWVASAGIDAALMGQRGAGLYRNYRQVPVVGVYRWLHNYNLALLVEVPQQVAFAPLYELLWEFVLVGLGSAVAAAGLVTVRSRYISRPVVAIATTAQAVEQAIANNDYQTVPMAPVLTQDEVGQLATRFNRMTGRIWDAHQALTEHSQNLEAMVADRTHALEDRNQKLQATLSELQTAQAQLLHTEKMSSLGQVVAGVAHEINNPVSFIQGNLVYAKTYAQELLDLLHRYEQQYPQPHPDITPFVNQIDLPFVREDFPRLVESMENGTARIAQVVRLLQQFARHDISGLKPMDVHSNLDNVLLLLNHRLKSEGTQAAIQVIRQYGDIPAIVADGGQLNQVFMNLLANAVDVLRNQKDNSSPQVRVTTGQATAHTITIGFHNNGPAIPPDHQAHLFEPFFSTKPLGQGTGLGLTICQQIITQGHGGSIHVQSRPNWGTEFILELPIKPGSPLPSQG